jgi:hypothetical protein
LGGLALDDLVTDGECDALEVPGQVLHERLTSKEQEDVELANAFNLQFVYIRENDLEKKQRLARIGGIAAFDADVEKLRATCDAIATKGRSYLETLSPVSD